MYMLKSYKGEILRKVVHLSLVSLLAIPLTPHYRQLFQGIELPYDATLLTYTLLTFISAFINSLQIRVPSIYAASLKIVREFRKRIIDYINENIKIENLAEFLRDIDNAFNKHEERFTEFIAGIEREYEKRYGYISITFGIVSITLAYILFGALSTLYGILALAIIDPITAITTLLTRNSKKIFKHTLPSITTAFIVYTLVCLLINNNIVNAISIALVAVTVELFSPEDNLTLPLFTALASYLLHH